MPERTCLGCRAVREKSGLVRFVAKDGELVLDLKGVLKGRGAYVCPVMECVALAIKKKDSFSRALKQKVNIPDAETLWLKIKSRSKQV